MNLQTVPNNLPSISITSQWTSSSTSADKLSMSTIPEDQKMIRSAIVVHKLLDLALEHILRALQCRDHPNLRLDPIATLENTRQLVGCGDERSLAHVMRNRARGDDSTAA